jgi:hypothetical protein
MENQRTSVRLRRRYKVAVNGSWWFTTDVCASGFCVELMRVLPLRTRVEGTIHVEEMKLPFAGEVAWATRGDWHLNLRGRMGVRLVQIAPEHARLFSASRVPDQPRQASRDASVVTELAKKKGG